MISHFILRVWKDHRKEGSIFHQMSVVSKSADGETGALQVFSDLGEQLTEHPDIEVLLMVLFDIDGKVVRMVQE